MFFIPNGGFSSCSISKQLIEAATQLTSLHIIKSVSITVCMFLQNITLMIALHFKIKIKNGGEYYELLQLIPMICCCFVNKSVDVDTTPVVFGMKMEVNKSFMSLSISCQWAVLKQDLTVKRRNVASDNVSGSNLTIVQLPFKCKNMLDIFQVSTPYLFFCMSDLLMCQGVRTLKTKQLIMRLSVTDVSCNRVVGFLKSLEV